MWTADSTQITADQTCWTADGYNGCDIGGGGSIEDYSYLYDHRRILKEDEEIIEFINVILTKGLL